MARSHPLIRSEGITESERYLKRLGERTFLSLWSYANVFRDQGGGQEVADLLVVFDDHVLIFSDKDCEFPESEDLDRDWGRWYRRAIARSAQQVWGAEGWVRRHPDRLFLDKACATPFPLPIPDPATAAFHRIVVAHGTADRCRRELGGSGGLRIAPDIIGDAHLVDSAHGGRAFHVGLIDSRRGFVHVLDDASLDIVMRELDTVTDLVAYLSRKEKLILGGGLRIAAREEDLLAHYLYPAEVKDERRFALAGDGGRLSIAEGVWEAFDRDEYRLAKRDADRVSYLWDDLIESSSRQIIAGAESFATHPGIRGGAAALRILASESRLHRRWLATALRDMVQTAPSLLGYRMVRVITPTEPGEPYYVFLLLSPMPNERSENDYRTRRRELLMVLCEVVKLRFPDAEDIVGIATELGPGAFRSQDIVYRDARVFTEEHRKNAQRDADAAGLLTDVVPSTLVTAYDFPAPHEPEMRLPFR